MRGIISDLKEASIKRKDEKSDSEKRESERKVEN